MDVKMSFYNICNVLFYDKKLFWVLTHGIDELLIIAGT